MKYIIYTDGACSGNPGPGGWGSIIIDEKKIKLIYMVRKNLLLIIEWNLQHQLWRLKRLRKVLK